MTRSIFALVFVLAGCTVDPGANPNRCGPDGGCPIGRRCHRPAQLGAGQPGFCVALEDAGPCIATGEEVCNGEDDDCDGRTDEELIHTSEHCNRCDERCEGPVPDCVPTGAGGTFECGNCPYTICSSGVCADTQSDEENCGRCGTRCDAGEDCVAGTCSCGGAGSDCGGTATSSCCGTQCVDFNTDAAHCGGCNRACTAGASCVDQRCVCGAGGPECSAPSSCCGSDCVDVTSSNAHCGGCGRGCPANAECTAGQCKCGLTADCRRTCTVALACL